MQGGCIIRAGFLGDVSAAYERNLDLPNLLVDPMFSKELAKRDAAWRRVVSVPCTNHSVAHVLLTRCFHAFAFCVCCKGTEWDCICTLCAAHM
jgi:6-phosphogluconate dehydrogenase